jgi:hypothetical protein
MTENGTKTSLMFVLTARTPTDIALRRPTPYSKVLKLHHPSSLGYGKLVV